MRSPLFSGYSSFCEIFMSNAHHFVYRTSDHELLGIVWHVPPQWHACTSFGAFLVACPSASLAEAYLHAYGLRMLNDPWEYYDPSTDTWHLVRIQEATQHQVRIILGPYAWPGVPTTIITAHQLAHGTILRPVALPDLPTR